MSFLEFHNVSKSFGKVEVLHNISFKLEKGKLFALMGENGAGKSTLMKILCGIHPEYQGEVLLNGNKIKFNNPREAEKAGIAIIHQELNLVNDLNVAENIFLGHEPIKFRGVIDFKTMYEESESLLNEFDFPYSVKTKVRNIPIGWQQMIEIAKALRLNAEIIVMDEPTSALSESEIKFLFGRIEELKKNGKTIIYISHRMKEIFEIADEAVVMRDGSYIGTYLIKDIDQKYLVSKMIGKEISETVDKKVVSGKNEVINLKSVSVKQNNKQILQNINFDVKKGEVVGIAGLLGAGRTELLKFIYGAYKTQHLGEVIYQGKIHNPKSPSRSIKSKIVYLSEDRKQEGIFAELSNLKNSSISILPEISEYGFVRMKEEKRRFETKAKELNVKMASIYQQIQHLSGGNQQKVLLSRILLINPDLLLLDEPTRGIDVGAKQEIYELITKLKEQGMGILFASSEIPELLLVSNRILVLNEGRQTALLKTNQTDSTEILNYAFEGTK
ncbi:MAG: sugar ABC transporter ATP-binding protein [Bacteroidota bacterium]